MNTKKTIENIVEHKMLDDIMPGQKVAAAKTTAAPRNKAARQTAAAAMEERAKGLWGAPRSGPNFEHLKGTRRTNDPKLVGKMEDGTYVVTAEEVEEWVSLLVNEIGKWFEQSKITWSMEGGIKVKQTLREVIGSQCLVEDDDLMYRPLRVAKK